MKIILREHVDHLGERGEIVTVATGYARNFLLPKGMAYLATPGNIKQIERPSLSVMNFEDQIGEILLGLAPGEVVTYGEVAAQAGRPGAARAVGNYLRKSTGLPWWRVVASSGRLVPGLEQRHAELLRSEGVELRNGKVAKSR